MAKTFKQHMPSTKEINQFVKSGAFDKQMKNHMPQIMGKVQKIDALSRKEAEMDKKELDIFIKEVQQYPGDSFQEGVKAAMIALGYRQSWVEQTITGIVL